MSNFRKFLEDDDYWTNRLSQFQAAAQGQKGAIEPTRSLQTTYSPTRTPTPQASSQKKFIRLRDGEYEQMTDQDEANGLTTLSRWNNPAKDGSYYTKDKATGRFIITRPNVFR